MWDIFKICILLTLWWSCALSQKCVTPLGKTSTCVSLHDCPDLLNVFKSKPLSQQILKFLQKSKCSLEGTSKVCCGPVPDGNPISITTETSTSSQEATQSYEYLPEDSLPAPREQCGNQIFTHRIYGGQDTEPHEFPWMALLGYKNRSGHINYKCGGSIINHRYVLTAAHCLSTSYTDKFGPLITVRLGEYNMSRQSVVDCKYDCPDPPQEILVASAYTHPGYDNTNQNRTHDIAILRLAKRAVYTDYVQPICLVSGAESMDEKKLFFAGWGRTLLAPTSPVKQKLGLTLFNKEKCIEKFRKKKAFLSDTQLCAGGKFVEDGCQGDSGGPLMMKTKEGIWEAVGIGSFGLGCGQDGWPGVYTSVEHYLSWIRSTLQMSNQ